MKLKFRHIFEKYTYIKFDENVSSGSRVVPCGQTDGRTDMTKLRVAFRNSAKAPKNSYSTNKIT
jgi:urease accessory protein UreF